MKLNKEEMEIISENVGKGYTVEFVGIDSVRYEIIRIFDECDNEIYFRNSIGDVWRKQ